MHADHQTTVSAANSAPHPPEPRNADPAGITNLSGAGRASGVKGDQGVPSHSKDGALVLSVVTAVAGRLISFGQLPDLEERGELRLESSGRARQARVVSPPDLRHRVMGRKGE